MRLREPAFIHPTPLHTPTHTCTHRNRDVLHYSLLFNGSMSDPKAATALSTMLRNKALNEADMTTLHALYSR
jgi:hypothetical protein